MIHSTRIQPLNDHSIRKGKWVLYWMQAAQRTRFNHALEYAIQQANELEQPMLVCFGLMDNYPEANERSYAFMLNGLADVREDLQQRGILFVVQHGAPAEAALKFGEQASLIVCDRNYLKPPKYWREAVATQAKCRVVQVETEVVVPVQEVSDKHEYAARTIRPKIRKQLDQYLVDLPANVPKCPSLQLSVTGSIDLTDLPRALKQLKIDRSVKASTRLIGGQTEAQKHLREFLQHDLKAYAIDRNEPAEQHTSLMSAYLHFGQISPVDVALAVQRQNSLPVKDRDVYLEELIVRRELSMNFVHYVSNYESYECLPQWARKTLSEHRRDKREFEYSLEELEQAKTHDPYWNAAQTEMTKTGFMHNYMRMYWGKKILEWSPTPQTGFEHTLHLNNKYLLDGRDANSYANVAWIYGMHDRPWGPERKIFGLVRFMNAAGLERKFDINAYVKRVAEMAS